MTTSVLMARRVNEDTRISDMKKSAQRLAGATLSAVPVFAAVGLAVAAIVVVLVNLPAVISGSFSAVDAIQYGGTITTMFGAAAFMFFASDTTTDEEMNAKKAARRGIKGSRRTAKKLGTTIVPVLTASHVEARIRVDEALKQKRTENGKKLWDQSASDAIAIMLFEDLGREPIILSLIENSGLISAKDIGDALTDIESHPTPLWEGVL